MIGSGLRVHGAGGGPSPGRLGGRALTLGGNLRQGSCNGPNGKSLANGDIANGEVFGAKPAA